MGVHSAYPGLTVEVHVNGKAVQEYEREDITSEECTVTRYIEATTAAKFQVVIHIPKETFPKDVSITMRLDGMRSSSICSCASEQDRKEIIKTAWEKVDKKWFHSDISFSELLISK
jgi:hypothetical protein